MYGNLGAGASGTGGAALAATGLWFDSLAMLVAATTLLTAGVALARLAPRRR
jgi:hypothetical protein